MSFYLSLLVGHFSLLFFQISLELFIGLLLQTLEHINTRRTSQFDLFGELLIVLDEIDVVFGSSFGGTCSCSSEFSTARWRFTSRLWPPINRSTAWSRMCLEEFVFGLSWRLRIRLYSRPFNY